MHCGEVLVPEFFLLELTLKYSLPGWSLRTFMGSYFDLAAPGISVLTLVCWSPQVLCALS